MGKYIRRIAFLLFGVSFALMCSEVAVRLVRPQITIDTLKPSYSFACYTKSPYAYLKLKPNASCTLHSNTNAFGDVIIKTNKDGLRSPEIKPEKAIQQKRILFLGDSFTLGWGIREENVYPRLVESHLRKEFPIYDIQGINAGINATGPLYQYLYAKKEGIQFHPDYIVVGFYPWNDIVYDEYGSEFVAKKDEKGDPDAVDSKMVYVDYTGVLRQKNLPQRLKIPFIRSSHVFNLIANTMSPLTISSEDAFLPVLPSRLFLSCLFKKSCTDLDNAKKQAQDAFLHLKTLADDNNSTLLVVIIPAEFQAIESSDMKYAIPLPLSNADRRYPNEYFMNFFEANGIASLDLLSAFSDHKSEQIYFDKDEHWSESGHALAAQKISEKLVELMKK